MLFSKDKIEIPDNCPDNCVFKEDLIQFDQSCMCTRCPIFNCMKDSSGFCMIEPENYREDWALEWKKFFKGEIDFPILNLQHEKTRD